MGHRLLSYGPVNIKILRLYLQVSSSIQIQRADQRVDKSMKIVLLNSMFPSP